MQDPRDAAFPEMPLNALSKSNPQHIVPLADMPALLLRLVHQKAAEPARPPAGLRYEVEVARSGDTRMDEMDRIGRRSVLACPDCHGVMWEIDEGDIVRYRCHVGHAYTSDTMDLALDDSLNRALGSALRALEERAALAEKLQNQAAKRGHNLAAETWAGRKAEFEAELQIIRKAIHRADGIEARQSKR
ncbi:MAG TPA: hypothetical protein VJV39_04040 [Dongiaceae bacterium]|nr:hypothetical protein [Dongiaceae bacterium]